jgi:hypothetical protein
MHLNATSRNQTMKNRMTAMVLAALGLAANCAHAQDYAREARYAQEVVSGLVVGDAANIKAASGRDFWRCTHRAKQARPPLS